MKVFICLLVLLLQALGASAQKNVETPEQDPALHQIYLEKQRLRLPKLIPYRKLGMWGYADSTGTIRVEAKYQQVEFFRNGVARVMLNNRWGVLDEQGKEVVPPQYEKMEQFEGILAGVSKDRKQGVINNKGKVVVPVQFDSATPLRDAFNKLTNFVKVHNYYPLTPEQQKNARQSYQQLFGLYDAEGKLVAPVKYSSIRAIGNGIVRLSVDNKHTYINETGETLLADAPYQAEKMQDGLAVVLDEAKKYGYMDQTGKLVIPLQYEFAGDFKQGLALVKKDGKAGLIDKQQNVVLPFEYESVVAYPESGVIVAAKGAAMGALTLKGKPLLAFEYQQVQYNPASNLFVLVQQKATNSASNSISYALMDRQQQLTFVQDVLLKEPVTDGLLKANKGNKVGFIDGKGKEVIPMDYDDAHAPVIGLIVVKKGQLYGVVDLNNKQVLPMCYNYLQVISPESFLVKITVPNVHGVGAYGIINSKGQEIAPLHYTHVGKFIDGKAVVHSNGRIGLIDTAGKEIVPLVKLPVGLFVRSGLEQGLYQVYSNNGYSQGYADLHGRLYFDGLK
jgi:hypothetical protein